MIREVKKAIKEYHVMSEIKKEHKDALLAFRTHTQPVYSDTRLIKDIREFVVEDDMFILIAVYLYSPIALYGGRINIEHCLSDILGVTKHDVNIAFSNAYARLLFDDDYQNKVEDVFKSVDALLNK